jgi:cold shock CspA family protein
MSIKGELVRWNEDRGFGFIKSESFKGDIFIHISALKSMPRKPRVGDVIYFDVTPDKNGKDRAENARIEGVSSKDSKTNAPTGLGVKFYVIVLIIAGMVGSYIFQAFFPDTVPVPSILQGVFEEEDFTEFSCRGKQHCSEMISCKEARYYLINCPNVEIDGDHDGVPCEMQWCK